LIDGTVKHKFADDNSYNVKANLEIVLWVPVAVVYDAGVGRRQVDAQPARLRAQQKHKPKINKK
jgi:hypothetical protein